MSKVPTTVRFIVTIALAANMFGCASSDRIAGCDRVLTDSVTIRLIDQFADQVDGASTRLGRFEISSIHKDALEIPGSQQPRGFLVRDPIARVQLKGEKQWTDVLTVMGSWMSAGEHMLAIKYKEKRFVLAQLDYGVPEGKHEMRIVVRANNGMCLVSDPFFSEVKKEGNSIR